jgi:hypothetical protein
MTNVAAQLRSGGREKDLAEWWAEKTLKVVFMQHFLQHLDISIAGRPRSR